MGIPDDINKALTTAFVTLATAQGWSDRVEWPNKIFAPTPGESWFRPSLLPGIPEAAAIGDDAPDLHVGVYQVSIFTPRGGGDGLARAAAEAVLTAFPRGGSASFGSAVLRFEKCYALSPIIEDKFYHLPVRIEYRTEL